ncbi:MAG: hypothetical protein N3B13_10340 [Deltaproteobacteria bacterium]|nr:hypothetical protein [Deltaproteobacteria bacterium]
MSLKKIVITAAFCLIGVMLSAQENPQEKTTDNTAAPPAEVKAENKKDVKEEKKEETSAPAATATQSASSEPSASSENKPKKEFFTGSVVGFGNSFGINPDNPLSTLSMKLLPKLNLPWTDFFVISGRIDISKEVTNSDSTSYQYETQLSDARIEFVFPELYREKFTDIAFSGVFRTSFPTSKASQYATLRWGNMIDLGISRGFFGEKGKPETQKVFLGYDFRFYKNWHKYTTSQVEESSGGYYKQYPLRVKTADYLNTGSTNLEYQVAHIFSGSVSITEKLTFVGYFWVINGWAYELYSGGKRGTRDSIDFNIELDYQVYKWLMVDFGLDTFQPQLLPNSTYTNNPFWRNTYDNYTTLYFDVSFIF